MMKYFEADMKRLKGILVTYEDKVKDISPLEAEQRKQVLDMLQDAYKLLKEEINDQTFNFKHGFRPALDDTADPSGARYSNVNNKTESGLHQKEDDS